ncbi:MAG: hypothetical protein K5629_08185 [Eubacteriales bacterium]|nr:hypothetical protein [Eubacteriales bacterium]
MGILNVILADIATGPRLGDLVPYVIAAAVIAVSVIGVIIFKKKQNGDK